MRLKIYELDPTRFLTAGSLAWQAALKQTIVKLDLLTDKKKVEEENITLFIDIQTLKKKNDTKDYDENKGFSYLQYWDVNTLYGWAMSQKLSVNSFECIKDTSQFNEDFIKSCNEESDERYFLDVDAQYLEKLHEHHNDFHLYLRGWRLKKSIRL